MRIQTKLIGGFLTITLIVLIANLFSVWQLRQVSYPLEVILPEELTTLKKVGELDNHAKLIRYYDEILTQSARNFAFTLDRRWEQRYFAFEPQLDIIIKEAIAKGDQQDKDIFSQVDKANIALVSMETAALQQALAGDKEGAITILESEEYWKQKAVYSDGLEKYAQKRGAQANRAYESLIIGVQTAAEEARKKILNSIQFTFIFVGCILLISILITILITRSITDPLNALIHRAKKISEGSFWEKIPERKDEIGELGNAFNEMIEDLQETTVSRDELVKEIDQRKTAEASLKEQRSAALNLMDDAEEARIKAERAEQKIKETADELERSNKELEQFAYVASHDLQEPVRKIVGFSQLFEKKIKGKMDEETKEYMTYIIDGAKRMQDLIQDLLQFSRVGRAELKLEPVDFNDIFKEVLDNLGTSIEEYRAQVNCEGLPTVAVHRVQMVQLFQNLIGNGIKYHGEVDPVITVSARKKDNEWEFSITDNGIGIDPQFYDKIFVIFQRLHTKDQYKGTGIGLALCKKIVERHGGRIWVESTPGRGSSFKFTLPQQHDEKRSVP